MPSAGSGPITGISDPLWNSSSALLFPLIHEWPETQTKESLLYESSLFSSLRHSQISFDSIIRLPGAAKAALLFTQILVRQPWVILSKTYRAHVNAAETSACHIVAYGPKDWVMFVPLHFGKCLTQNHLSSSNHHRSPRIGHFPFLSSLVATITLNRSSNLTLLVILSCHIFNSGIVLIEAGSLLCLPSCLRLPCAISWNM